jgi:hypothetical protein
MEFNMDIEITALRNHLEALSPSTSIEGAVASTVLGLLSECWDSLEGSSYHKTTADKLWRAENLKWIPPILSFELERHGSTVNGSSRAELHYWQVNVPSGVAKMVKTGRRQLYAMDKRMNTLAVAQETAKLIRAKAEHPSLKWVEKDVYAVVQISMVIPETNQQTTTSRRKKYRAHLEKIMLDLGWVRADRGNQIGFRFGKLP